MVTAASTYRRLEPMLLRHGGMLSFLGHQALFALAFFCAFGIYFNFKLFGNWVVPFYLPMLPVVLVIKTLVYSKMRLFRRGWRYFGMRDLFSVVKASWISTAGFIAAAYGIDVLYRTFGTSQQSYFFHVVYTATGEVALNASGNVVQYQFPQSVFGLDLGMTIALVCGSRIWVRLYHEQNRRIAADGAKKCLILGAGDTGEALLREVLRMSEERYRVVGFLDDSPAKQGTTIHDVPVLGRIDEVRSFCEMHQIEELLIALPGLPQKELRKIVEECRGMNVRFQIIPAMEEVIAGRVRVSQVRDVDIKDLLGRAQVTLDEAGLKAFLQDKRVLVTGAGGSIGSEICRQVSRYGPSRLILVEQAENNLFEIDRELAALAPEVLRVCRIADICDATRINGIFDEDDPEVVFHAAAHKHVPMMECNVGEAIKNNIFGTRTVADAAQQHGVERFVMISTDKAVNPTSVMGCTKRVAEMYIQQLRQASATHFMTVRFGNVLGSSGSVVPIFARQIAAGGPVTVTDPEMTRYFMTIPEATQLVLQAGVIGTDGEIFVLDMGEPVKIVDLAREMITLSGLRPGEDIEIVFTGVRPGEKLFEELSVRGEDMSPTRHDQIYVWRNRKEDWARICREIDELADCVDAEDGEALKDRLSRIVTEYVPEPVRRLVPMEAPTAASDEAALAK